MEVNKILELNEKRLTKNEIRKKAADYLLVYCGNLQPNEKLLIIFDKSTEKLIPLFEEAASKITNFIKKNQIDQLSQHGLEPPIIVSRNMIKSDLIIALTSKSLAHTKARNNACKSGSRYLSLAEYSLALLENKAIFGVKKNKIYSPPINCYKGITYKFFKSKIKSVIKKEILLKTLSEYDEIILIGSGKGVASVKTVDKIKWKRKSLKIFNLLNNHYLQAVKKYPRYK